VAGKRPTSPAENKHGIKPVRLIFWITEKFFKHQSHACLIVGKGSCCLSSIIVTRIFLAKVPPEIVLQFEGVESTSGSRKYWPRVG